jgi:hypothetical protein
MESRLLSWSGIVAGSALAPLAAVGSAVRRARVFHPSGTVLWGKVTPFKRYDEWSELAERLGGSALVRFSGAWWKERQWPDVLGCALRFTEASEPSVEPIWGDQDLLFATVRVPATTLFAPLTTHVDDYLSNAYFGVSPFTDPQLGRIKLRLVADHAGPRAASRAESLDRALEQEPVRLRLEARNAAPKSAYHTIAEIDLYERVQLDQEKLSFDPYRTGRDLSPAGFVHALRIPVYSASRQARQLVAG